MQSFSISNSIIHLDPHHPPRPLTRVNKSTLVRVGNFRDLNSVTADLSPHYCCFRSLIFGRHDSQECLHVNWIPPVSFSSSELEWWRKKDMPICWQLSAETTPHSKEITAHSSRISFVTNTIQFRIHPAGCPLGHCKFMIWLNAKFISYPIRSPRPCVVYRC